MRATLSVIAATAALAFVVAGGPVFAHHAFSAQFDPTKPVTIKGTITKMEWSNPHSWLYVDVKGEDGKVEAWEIELGPPNNLLRAGWSRRDLPVGAEVTITGFRSKDGRPSVNGNNVTLADGKKLFSGNPGDGDAK
jgi:hypothetical protein